MEGRLNMSNMTDYAMWLDSKGYARWDDVIGELITIGDWDCYCDEMVKDYQTDAEWHGEPPNNDDDEDDMIQDDDEDDMLDDDELGDTVDVPWWDVTENYTEDMVSLKFLKGELL